MLVKILFGLALVVVIVMAIATTKPNTFRIARSITISAPASAIYPHLNNLKKFNAWSPWAKLDPESKAAFDGPEEGVGAKLSWEGKKTGKGSMTVAEINTNELVRYTMEFLKPMKATNTAEFTLKTQGNATVVEWSIYGDNTYIRKIMSVLFNCDKMIGEQFEKGLADLKSTVEKKS